MSTVSLQDLILRPIPGNMKAVFSACRRAAGAKAKEDSDENDWVYWMRQHGRGPGPGGLPHGMAQIQQMAGGAYPVVRINPNIPASVGEGMIPYCTEGLTAGEEADFCRLMAGAGRMDPLAENLMDAACCVSGCGPAWAYQFIEALADGGVACGLPRAKAQQYAAQMLLGSARMLLESGSHPGVLKDAVCSPGGTTIQGVRVLEERGFRGAVTDAVIAAYEKTLKMREG